MSIIKKSIAAVAALGAIAFGAATIADAASKNSGRTQTAAPGSGPTGPMGGPPPPPGMPPREELSAEDAAKVKAAALAEVPGATVLRTEAGGPYPTPYHAHIKTGGKRKVVLVDESFEATGVQADRGPGGRGGGPPRGGMPPRGGFRPPGGPGMREEALTGETKEKVEAAVLAEYPGATILRTETNGDESAPYESHITTTDGRELEVIVNEAFEVVDAHEHPSHP